MVQIVWKWCILIHKLSYAGGKEEPSKRHNSFPDPSKSKA